MKLCIDNSDELTRNDRSLQNGFLQKQILSLDVIFKFY